jgi:hypothetical protein
MKKLLFAACMLLASSSAYSQTPVETTFVKGTLDIKYNSRIYKDKENTRDFYMLDLNVNNSVGYKGNVYFMPLIMGGIGGNTVKQSAFVSYDMECDVMNPANPTQRRNVGKIFGKVPVQQDGTYRYNTGELKIGIHQMGNARGIDAKFDGITMGKPLHKPKGFVRTAKNALTLKGGKSKITVKDYDLMEFRQHVIPVGPVPIYPEITVNGAMVFDYDRSAWYFHNLSITYTEKDNRNVTDKISGSLRWIDAEDKDVTGKGHYDFDIRVNEPVATESDAFAKADDESAFFTTAPDISVLGGTMNYVDKFQGETVTESSITIDLKGTKLNKQQTMNLTKVIIFSALVPLNAE